MRYFLFGKVNEPDLEVVRRRLGEIGLKYDYGGIDSDNPDGVTLITAGNHFTDARSILDFLKGFKRLEERAA